MSSIQRATLPENFYDKTSAQLIAQPEPQYLLANWFLSAMALSLPIPSALGLDGRAIGGVGSAYSSADRDRLKLAEALPSELMAVKVDFSAATGGTIRINRPKFSDTTYTEASRKIVSGQTISTSAINVGSEQTNLTLFTYAGPYDSTNSRVAPYGVQAFDANMGIHKLSSIVGTHMARDFHKFLETQYVTLGDLGTSVYPDSMTADDDATSAGSFPMTLEQVSRTEQSMDEAHLPTLGDGSRVLLLSPQQWKQLKHDPEYESQAEFHKEFNLLFPNYVGSVSKFHIFKSTTLSKPTNSSTVAVHRGIAIAPGAFMGGMGRPVRVASSTDDNYGETAKVIWIGDLAFGVADNRFLRSVRAA